MQLTTLLVLTGGGVCAQEEDDHPSTASPQIKLQAGRPQAHLPAGSFLHDYDDIASPETETASRLAARARTSLKSGNYTRAIYLIKEAMKKDDDDIDIHALYALSLEAKIDSEEERDPELFKTCVHEWLLVYRQEVGEEKGMTFKGLNIMGTMWNDEYAGGMAKKHLKKLCGYLPKYWETDNRYVQRVLKPAETSVTGKVKSVSH